MRVIAIDYGRVRVGLAVAHVERGLPRPLPPLINDTTFWSKLKGVVSEWEVSKVVVGLPLLDDGEEGGMAVEVREFAERVASETGLPVELWNEELSTWEAKEALRGKGVSEKRQKSKRDSVAAALILERYLKNQGLQDGSSTGY
jgi:putative Holliday junction resolvase